MEFSFAGRVWEARDLKAEYRLDEIITMLRDFIAEGGDSGEAEAGKAPAPTDNPTPTPQA